MGGLLTIAAGLIGAVFQSAREHRRWIRENRLDAFIKAQKILSELDYLTTVAVPRAAAALEEATSGEKPNPATAKRVQAELQDVNDRVKALTARFPADNSPLVVLGPQRVRDAANGVARVVGDDDARREAQSKLQREFSRALRLNR